MTNKSHSNAINDDYVLNVKHNIFQRELSKQFNYNDGDQVENRLQEIISQAEDVSDGSEELFSKAYNWPSVYHLSPARANLLRPLENILRGKKVLELGSGCGAISRFLAEIGCDLTCVEGSPRRAAITSMRCRGLNNVSVFSDNFQDFACEERFDVVTLIGVLEYSRTFIQGTDPVAEALALARSFLKDDGTLLVAIENKLGLKYWAGAPEDHIGVPYYGLQSLYSEKSAVTFGRRELEGVLRDAKFSDIEFFYPFPDYKLPNLVLTEAALIQSPELLNNLLTTCFAPNQATPYLRTFSEGACYRALVENGLIGDLANSFLVIAKDGAKKFTDSSENIAYAYSQGRRKALGKEVNICRSGTEIIVKRRLLRPEEPPNWMKVSPVEKLLPGEIYFNKLLPIVNRVGWGINDVVTWFLPVYLNLLEISNKTADQPLLPGMYIDATPFNFISDGGRGDFFDLEWAPWPEIELDFVAFRGILYSLLRIGNVSEPSFDRSLPLVKIAAMAVNELSGKNIQIEDYLNIEIAFQNEIAVQEINIGSFHAVLDIRQKQNEREEESNKYAQNLISKLNKIRALIASTKTSDLNQNKNIELSQVSAQQSIDKLKLEEARKLLSSEKHDAAIEILIRLASENSCLPDVYIELACFAVKQGDQEAAIDLLDAGASKENPPGESTLRLAEFYNLAERPSEAISALSRYLRTKPNDFRALGILKKSLELSVELPPVIWARLLTDLRYQPTVATEDLLLKSRILDEIEEISRT